MEAVDQGLYNNTFFRGNGGRGGPLEFFKASRGIRQRSPLSPLLFIIVTEALNKWLARDRDVGMISGLKVGEGVGEEEITRLFFEDDILIS